MLASTLAFELLLILLLLLANGVFSMSEIAVVSARKTRLRQRAEAGDARARRALELAEHPTRFLSTVQIGITLVGIFLGAYGGASLAAQLAAYLERFPSLGSYTEEVALGVVVVVLTFLSLVIGELVPKSIALTNPERIAAWVAGPMSALSRLAGPLVKLLTFVTDGIVRLLGIRKSDEPPVTEEEVTAMLEEGAEAGVFEEEEHDLVERVFRLSDQHVTDLMTPRQRIAWLDIVGTNDEHRAEIIKHRYSFYLVCEGEVDSLLGMVRVKDLLAELLEDKPLDLRAVLRKPLVVPASTGTLRLLELFRESGMHLAVVIDEYGGVEGLVTLNDVLLALAGTTVLDTDPRIVRRDDGSWLIDGSISMDELWEYLELPERRDHDREEFRTLAGFVVTQLAHIPRSGEHFDAYNLRFEVMDMDAHRVDKVLITPMRTETAVAGN